MEPNRPEVVVRYISIDAEVIPDPRFSASKISRLPRKILVPATIVPLPQFRDVICVALLMQRTCNTHATHMQHDMQHEPFPWKFPGKVPRGDENLHFPF